jgi:S1-C subfamily serine protease
MACTLLVYPIHLLQVLAYSCMLAGTPVALEYDLQKIQDPAAGPTLVLVTMISETHGAKDTVEIDGQEITGYSPTIIQTLSSTGIVLDQKGHIMTFLGYRWIDIQNHDPRIEISTGDKQTLKGTLIGIDQSNGVAVIRLLGAKLNQTPICSDCEVKDGATVVAPIIERQGLSQYRKAQILSVGAWPGIPEQSGWMLEVNRSFPDIGLPILTTDHRVLGFVASQDPMGMRTFVYPISQLLASAERILKKGGDIRAGWLGVFLTDEYPAKNPGVVIRSVEPDSPAQKAGLLAGDFLLKYNGQKIQDNRQFIYLVQATPIGSKAKLEIARQGNPMKITASIEGRKPMQNRGRLSFNLPGSFGLPVAGTIPEPAPSQPRLRVGLETLVLNPPLAEALNMPGQTGLLVTNVAKSMPADQAGVLVGDVITAMDGEPVVDVLSVASYLQTHGWSDQLVLTVLRKGVGLTITVQVPPQNR